MSVLNENIDWNAIKKWWKRGSINKYLQGKIEDEKFTKGMYLGPSIPKKADGTPDFDQLPDPKEQRQEYNQAKRNLERLKKFAKEKGIDQKNDPYKELKSLQGTLTEKAESKSQQRLMGMVYAYKKGELKDPSEKVKKIAKGISMKDAKKYAETKHKGLPKKVDEKDTREAVRSMSFGDFIKYTTPQFLGEEWSPVNYEYVWIDGNGNKTFIRVSQNEQQGKVNIVAYGPDRMRRSLSSLMFMHPDLGHVESEQKLKHAIYALFDTSDSSPHDDIMPPSEGQVLQALRSVTKLDDIRKA